MSHRLALLAAFTAGLAAGLGRAEKVDMSADELRDTATHVVVGTVAAVYERAEASGDWKYTRYVAEVRVSACEKGAGLKKGELAYVRYWRRSWRGKGLPPPSTAGHRGLPAPGEAVRVYLARNAYDGFSFDNKDGGSMSSAPTASRS